jgi:glycosyltransferase involved in cell wall biosynthesis
MEWWFYLYLWSARALGYSIVWTAHDLLPHEQVFANDALARDRLIAGAREIIALSEATAVELRALGAQEVRVIPFGSYASPYPLHVTDEEARASFGFKESDVVLALIGRVESYKGADLLLRAVAKLPETSRIKVLLAGSCSDGGYQKELRRLASETPGRVVTRFEWIADDDLARYFQAADMAIFPFREITNSGSALLALSFAKPIVIPNLATLQDIPIETAIRFEPGEESLVAALIRAEKLSATEYRDMSAAALAWATKIDWADAAQETIGTYETAVSKWRSRFKR